MTRYWEKTIQIKLSEFAEQIALEIEAGYCQPKGQCDHCRSLELAARIARGAKYLG